MPELEASILIVNASFISGNASTGVEIRAFLIRSNDVVVSSDHTNDSFLGRSMSRQFIVPYYLMNFR